MLCLLLKLVIDSLCLHLGHVLRCLMMVTHGQLLRLGIRCGCDWHGLRIAGIEAGISRVCSIEHAINPRYPLWILK